MKQFAIIVAGGVGKRMESEIPKQFLLLGNEPILMHTIRAFHNYNNAIEIVVALPEDQVKYWQTLCANHKFTIRHTVVKGGKTRHHSVKNAISKITQHAVIAVHDGVRPLVNNALIQTCFDTAQIMGNAVPVTELSDSIRKLDKDSSVMADRSAYRLVQTPQVFRSEVLIRAFEQPYHPSFTDEATLVERAGNIIHLVRGQPENIKITNALDLCIARAILDANNC